MTEVTWRLFKHLLPKNNAAIIVEDHEGNRTTGIWSSDKGFENMNEFPIGKIVKWCPIKLVFCRAGIEFCKIFYENGEEIKMEDLYDFSDILSS